MEHLEATVSAIGSVVTTVLIGTVTARRIPSVAVSTRDLSLLTTAIGVPSLLFSDMADRFTTELLNQQSAALAVAAVAACAMANATGRVVGWWAFPEDAKAEERFLLMIGSSFQSTFVLPLALLQSVQADWLQGAVWDRAVAYLFVYATAQAVIMWSAGPEMARTEVSRRAPSAPGGTGREEGNVPPKSKRRRVIERFVAPLWSPPVVAVVIGAACGVAGLRGDTSTVPGVLMQVLLGATRLAAAATVPSSLLVLGINMRASGEKIWARLQRHSGAEAAGRVGEPPLRDLIVLTASMSLTRLALVPAVTISFFHFVVRHVVPAAASDPAMVLVLFVESSAPTAIAVSLMLTVSKLPADGFAQAVFVQYVLVILTSALWTIFTLWYVETYTDVRAESH